MKTECKFTVALLLLSVANGSSVLRSKDLNETSILLLSDEEQLAEECDCGVYGSCHFENGRKKCTCAGLTAEFDGKCVECGCGEHANACYFKRDGTKICYCDYEFIYVNGQCRECYCGSHGVCIFELGRKKCICGPNYIEKDGLCTANEYSTASSSLMTTILTSTVTTCYCGFGGTCHRGWFGEKICNCFSGYAPYNEHCYECDCGKNGICSIQNDVKICKCDNNFAEMDGQCLKCDCGPYGSCSFEYNIKRCKCKSYAVERNGECVPMESTTLEHSTTTRTTVIPSTTQYCYCGAHSNSCRYDWKGNKKCDCIPGYVENYGTCEECDCGQNGNCTFEYGRKKCLCNSFTSEKNGKCVECDCGRNGNCTFEYGRKKCFCNSLTSEKDGKCVDCNCGVNTQSCFFSIYGSKICSCDFGYIQTNGYCAAICNEDKCLHGKCEIAGNGFKCRCNEGFTGQRCEEKVQTKSRKQDLWMLLQLLVVFAIFILLSGMFCFWTRILNKMSKK